MHVVPCFQIKSHGGRGVGQQGLKSHIIDYYKNWFLQLFEICSTLEFIVLVV